MMTLLFAKVFAIYFLVAGIALLMNPERFRRWSDQMMADDSAIMLGSVTALILGAFIVSTHNVWVMDWPVLITVLGWWSVIKGAGMMIFPGFADLFRPMMNGACLRVYGILVFLFGALFAYHGWM